MNCPYPMPSFLLGCWALLRKLPFVSHGMHVFLPACHLTLFLVILHVKFLNFYEINPTTFSPVVFTFLFLRYN